MNTQILSWDWKENLDVDELNEALQKVFDRKHCPFVADVPNTGGDNYAVVVASQEITPERAQELWDEFNECELPAM